jgi:hypothetical protein
MHKFNATSCPEITHVDNSLHDLIKFSYIDPLGNNDYLVELLLQHPQLNVNLRGMEGYTALIRDQCYRTFLPVIYGFL